MGMLLYHTMMVVLGLASFIMVDHVYIGYSSPTNWLVGNERRDLNFKMRKMQEVKSYFVQQEYDTLASSPSPSPSSPVSIKIYFFLRQLIICILEPVSLPLGHGIVVVDLL